MLGSFSQILFFISCNPIVVDIISSNLQIIKKLKLKEVEQFVQGNRASQVVVRWDSKAKFFPPSDGASE